MFFDLRTYFGTSNLLYYKINQATYLSTSQWESCEFRYVVSIETTENKKILFFNQMHTICSLTNHCMGLFCLNYSR